MLIATETNATEQTERLIQDSATGCYQQALAAWRNLYMLVWNNPFGLTPQQVFDIVGTDGGKMFQWSYQLGELLNSVGAGLVNAAPEGVTYRVEEDGRVTITS